MLYHLNWHSEVGCCTMTAPAVTYHHSVPLLHLLLQAMASTVFPEAFGLDRHRLRLKAGATEKRA